MDWIAAGQMGLGLLTAGASNRNDKLNRRDQMQQNRTDRDFQRDMYDWQVRDNRYNWAMEQAYNHPLQQMNRLRQAGLNPNLIYGKGADNTASSIQSASGSASGGRTYERNGIAQGIGLMGQGLQSYVDNRVKQAQADNLGTLSALNSVKIAGQLTENARSKFDYEQAQRLKDIVVERELLRNEGLRTDIMFTTDENQRQALANTANLAYTAEKILSEQQQRAESKSRMSNNSVDRAKMLEEIENIKQVRELLKNDTLVRKAEAELAERGVFKSDPYYLRELSYQLREVAGQLSDPDANRKPFGEYKDKGIGGITR